jgi:CHASE2 domain-containing sensor protein
MAKTVILIALILLGCSVALVYGLLHSPRSRKLAIAALIIVAALIILIGLWVFIVKTWFPLRF